MRRLFVICLILLLPLNMFGLAMAASAMQTATASEHAVSQVLPAPGAAVVVDATSSTYLSATFDCDFSCDIDPDEPPAGADIHDTVNEEVGLRCALLAGRVLPPGASLRPSHSSVPLLKPPRAV